MTEIQINKLKGQNSRIIVGNPPHNKNYIYICFLKRKTDSFWEDITKAEGVIVKLWLEDLKRIINLLKGQTKRFTLKYKKEIYEIYFNWEGLYFTISILQ